jgi:hypothetical protein
MPTDDVNEFLLSGGEPPLKYETPGTSHTGKIISAEKQQQREIDTGKLKTWDDGEPQWQIVVRLQTSYNDSQIEDDDGIRRDFLRGQKLGAVRAALRKARARLEPGGELTITYTGDGEARSRGFNAPKLYTAAYVPPGDAAVADILGPAEVKRPPGVGQEEWDKLPPEAKQAVAAALPQY